MTDDWLPLLLFTVSMFCLLTWTNKCLILLISVMDLMNKEFWANHSASPILVGKKGFSLRGGEG